MAPVPFSSSRSENYASSQMGKAQIAPIVSGTQIKANASPEAIALKHGGAGKHYSAISGEKLQELVQDIFCGPDGQRDHG